MSNQNSSSEPTAIIMIAIFFVVLTLTIGGYWINKSNNDLIENIAPDQIEKVEELRRLVYKAKCGRDQDSENLEGWRKETSEGFEKIYKKLEIEE